MRKMFYVAALLALAVAIGATYAGAITNGQPDGDRHPYVAVLVDDFVTPGYFERFCTGTLVAPQIVLTAAHCLLGPVDDEIWVSFDSVYRPGVSTIIHGTGIAAVDPAIFRGNAGVAAQHGNSNLGNDIAVVHLDEEPGLEPATLPAAGFLSTLSLQSHGFLAVGYGRTRADKTKGPGNIEPNVDPAVRNAATLGFQNLLGSSVTFSQSPSTGDGGTCFGDSGGPVFLDDSDVVVATTIFGDAVCRASGQYYRLDIPFAREFLGSQGVPVP